MHPRDSALVAHGHPFSALARHGAAKKAQVLVIHVFLLLHVALQVLVQIVHVAHLQLVQLVARHLRAVALLQKLRALRHVVAQRVPLDARGRPVRVLPAKDEVRHRRVLAVEAIERIDEQIERKLVRSARVDPDSAPVVFEFWLRHLVEAGAQARLQLLMVVVVEAHVAGGVVEELLVAAVEGGEAAQREPRQKDLRHHLPLLCGRGILQLDPYPEVEVVDLAEAYAHLCRCEG
mmetsp:Transcript_1680/g.4355  ORF Transcript_1680/g.4355 Transcript_1680/m.4355 type:complete len:234 (-) Transcript_1680:675-1376(-)